MGEVDRMPRKRMAVEHERPVRAAVHHNNGAVANGAVNDGPMGHRSVDNGTPNHRVWDSVDRATHGRVGNGLALAMRRLGQRP